MIIPLGLATTQSTAGDFASALSRGPGWTAGTEEAGKHDYWVAAKNSKTEWAIFLFSGAFFVVGWIASIAFARRLGLPEYSLGWRWWLYLVPFALANAAVHESGHALVAWVFHHQIRVISVGPFTLSKDAQGYSFKARWDRLLLDAGGYMRSVGTPQQHARLHQIAVVAAGPVASLLSGLLAVAVLLSMPVTPWKAHWELVYFYGLLAFDYGFASLIPAGYSDGSMLLHLILWTPAGQLLVSKNAAPQTRKAAG